MFSVIDIHLIDIFQWTVRQFELFTPITRKNIVDLSLSLVKIALAVFFLLTVVRYLTKFSIFVFSDLFFLYAVNDLLKDLQKINIEKEHDEVLPKEIITRRGSREFNAAMCIPILLFFFLLVSPITLTEKLLFIDFAALLQDLFFCSVFFLIFCIEYFLCTTSLPPGEKERKKAERETRNMIPIKN